MRSAPASSSANETTAGARSSVDGERLFVEIRHDVIHRERTFSQITKLGELAPQLVGWPVPGTETAKRASVGDRCRQRGRREDAHPRLDDRNLDTDEVTQWRTHPDHPPAATVAAASGTHRRGPPSMRQQYPTIRDAP